MIAKIYPGTKKIDFDSFSNSDIVYLHDHMPHAEDLKISIDGNPFYFRNTIIDLFKKHNIEWENKCFISNHYLKFEDFKNFKVDSDNYFMAKQAEFFVANKVPTFICDDIKYKFTFLSNKARYHRVLSSMVISNLFELAEIRYSFNHHHNNHAIAAELLLNTNYNFSFKFLPHQYLSYFNTYHVDKDSRAVVKFAPSCSEAYKFIYNDLFRHSAISIITEPCFLERGSIVTEKTLMAIYSGHFMIWPGAWKLPESVKQIGIDIFDDIIDHSYQYIEHPGNRVVEAFLRNIDLLNDIKKQERLRNHFVNRLENNIKLVKDITQLKGNINKLNINR
jgi:hypothetical protein